ncbi:hypothetical protein [Candidatus Darwinibacter acetoxidans]
MQHVFNDDLVFSFQEVVEKSLNEFFKENCLISFQKAFKKGMDNLGDVAQLAVEIEVAVPGPLWHNGFR